MAKNPLRARPRPHTAQRRAGRLIAGSAALALGATLAAPGLTGAGAAPAAPGDRTGGVSGSTSVSPGVSGSTSVSPGVSGSTSVSPGVSGSTSTGASAVATAYVALGDSYSSGTGTRQYIDDGTDCLRSVHAYPSLIAAARGHDLDYRACSGAVVADVRANQLGALSAQTGLVTISIGGNDADFTGVLTTCAAPAWMTNCDAAIDRAQTFIDTTLPTRLSTLYGEIAAAAPNAQVVVVGYPRIFMGEDCNALTWFSPQEQTRLNAAADRMNARTASAASSAGFDFVNPTSAFTGHAVCDSPEWINGLSNPIVESYHPNIAGHASGYTPLVSARTAGARVQVTDDVLRRAEALAPRYAAQQRPYAAYDRGIEPRFVERPDLTTPQARAAAARAGVDLSSPASIARADRAAEARR